MPIKNAPREDILVEAINLITGDRNAQYGPPTQDFDRTAELLNVLGYRGPGGRKILKHDIAVIVTQIKQSRIVHSPGKRDNWTDTAGYAGCGWECVVEELEAGEIEQ